MFLRLRCCCTPSEGLRNGRALSAKVCNGIRIEERRQKLPFEEKFSGNDWQIVSWLGNSGWNVGVAYDICRLGFQFQGNVGCSAYVTSKSVGKSKFQEMPGGGSRFPFKIINYSTNLLPHCLREYLQQCWQWLCLASNLPRRPRNLGKSASRNEWACRRGWRLCTQKSNLIIFTTLCRVGLRAVSEMCKNKAEPWRPSDNGLWAAVVLLLISFVDLCGTL